MEELEREAVGREVLLGWTTEYFETSHISLEVAFEQDCFDELRETVSDHRLRTALIQATQNRISAVICSPAGLYAVRWLAASMRPDADAQTALISQRHSTLADVDTAMAMSQGRVVAFGPKDEVIDKVIRPTDPPASFKVSEAG